MQCRRSRSKLTQQVLCNIRNSCACCMGRVLAPEKGEKARLRWARGHFFFCFLFDESRQTNARARRETKKQQGSPLTTKKKICREENSEVTSTGLLSYHYNWYFLCRIWWFDFSIPLLYPIYHYSRYALDIVIFVCFFKVLILIFVNPIIILGKSLHPVTL